MTWTKIFETFIPGPPRGQPRPRAQAMMRGGRFVAHVHKSHKAEIAEAIVRASISDETRTVTERPVELCISVYIQPPKTMTRARREEVALGRAFPAKKPDLKNIIALVEDVLTGRVYRDDAQVVCISATKDYTKESAPGMAREGIQVVVNEARP